MPTAALSRSAAPPPVSRPSSWAVGRRCAALRLARGKALFGWALVVVILATAGLVLLAILPLSILGNPRG
ncbi:MAG: hypothetical protein KBB39_15215 [Phycicoccus sp.]|nr:hypothetical protein [Phycicoccus sp.]